MEENPRSLKSPRKNPTPRKLVKVHMEADACHTNDKHTHNAECESRKGPTIKVSVSKTGKISNAVLGNYQKSSESHRKSCKSSETKIIEEARKHKDGQHGSCLSSKSSSLKRKLDDCAVECESKRSKSNSAVQNFKFTASNTGDGGNCRRLLSGADSVQTNDDVNSQLKSVSFCSSDHYDMAIDLSRKVSKVKLSADALAENVLPTASAESSSRLLSVDTSLVVSASSCSNSTNTIGSKVSAKDSEVLENATVCLSSRFGCNLSEGESNECCFGTPECAKAKDSNENKDNSTVTLGSNVESVYSNIRITPAASEQIQELTDELNILNQQSSHISTHLYRRQTPKRKRGFGLRQHSSGLASQNPSTSGTPFRRWFRRTPSKSSPRATPKAAFRNMSPLGSKLICSPTTRKSSTKHKTPSKSSAKRKLYPDTPDDDMDNPKPSVVEVDKGQMSMELMKSSEDIFDSNPLVLSFDMESMEMNW